MLIESMNELQSASMYLGPDCLKRLGEARIKLVITVRELLVAASASQETLDAFDKEHRGYLART